MSSSHPMWTNGTVFNAIFNRTMRETVNNQRNDIRMHKISPQNVSFFPLNYSRVEIKYLLLELIVVIIIIIIIIINHHV